MSMILDAPTMPTRVAAQDAGLDIAGDVEAWLRQQPLPEAPVQWRPAGGSPVPVRSREELGIRVAGLAALGSWGVAERAHGGRWGQIMHVEDGWIVEVNGIPGPECFARRVSLDGFDRVASAALAADILWAWLAGRLLAGYELIQL